jgi:hypothetical protein
MTLELLDMTLELLSLGYDVEAIACFWNHCFEMTFEVLDMPLELLSLGHDVGALVS